MNTIKIRVISLCCIFAVLISMLPSFSIGYADSWSDDYTTWSQSDPVWKDKKIVSKTMSEAGSLVTAVAKLMVHSGQRDVAEFNPGICLDEMISCGLFPDGDDMYLSFLASYYFSQYAPNLTSVKNTGVLQNAWSENEAISYISEYLNDGYYVIVMTSTASGEEHWMCVDKVADGHLYVMDNGAVIDLYSSSKYSGVTRCVFVEYSDVVASEPSETYIAPSLLRVRTKPSLDDSSKVVEKLSEGTRITVYSTVEADGYVWGKLANGNWCAISICTYYSGALYTISYDANGGSGAPSKTENPSYQNVKLSSVTPSRENYTFVGWATSNNATTAKYQPGESININSDVTLYAVWKEKECKHSYDSNVIAPSQTQVGYTRHTCSLCGYAYVDSYVDSLGIVTVKDSVVSVSVVLAKTDLERKLSVKVGSKSYKAYNVEMVEADGFTTVSFDLYGIALKADTEYNIKISIGSYNAAVTWKSDVTQVGYVSCVSSVYKKYASIVINSEYQFDVGEYVTAVSDTGRKYEFYVCSKLDNGGYNLVCESIANSLKYIYFTASNIAVPISDGYNNTGVIECSDDQVFAAYYQTKDGSSEGVNNLRFVFVANTDLLEEVESCQVTITFYKGDAVVRIVTGIYGGENGIYKTYDSIVADGMIYIADSGCELFAQQVIGVPDNAYDNFTVIIKDTVKGDILFNVSLN